MDVNEQWIARLQRVLPAAVDTLSSFEHQIQHCLMSDASAADDLLDQLHSQIIDLRRMLETIVIIF